MKKLKNEEKLNIIKNAINDTRIIIDKDRPSRGIKRTLFLWVLCYLLINIFFIIFSKISLACNFWGTDIYFSLYRVLTLLLYIILPAVYLISIKFINMTLKETIFLKNFCYIPILLSICKLIYPLSYYLNFEILIQLYDTIPLEMIFIIIGLIQFYNYFKKPKYLCIIMLSIGYVLIFTFLKTILFNQLYYVEVSEFLITLTNILDYFNENNLFVLGILFLSIGIMKDESYEF